MSYNEKGLSLTTGIQLIGDRLIDNPVERTLVRRIRADYPGYISSLPVRGTSAPGLGSVFPLLEYFGCTVEEGAQVGGTGVYILTWKQTEPDSGELPPDPVTRRRATIVERDMREHEDFETELKPSWNEFTERMFTDGSVSATLRGRRTWPEIAAEVSITTYYAADPGEIQGRLGQLGSPPGEGGSGTSWKITDGWNGKEGRWWAETLVYQYKRSGWDEVADKAED